MFVKQRLWYNVCETETGIIFLECETETGIMFVKQRLWYNVCETDWYNVSGM
jgi:hypothetical protein